MAAADMESVFLEQHVEKQKNEFQTLKGKQRKAHRCTYPGCKAKFVRPSKLERHLCIHTGERRFVCDVKDCDKAYTNANHLKRHKITHSGVKQIFTCKFCAAEFTLPQNLSRHYKRTHDNNPLQLYRFPKVCEICQAEFPTRKKLQTHVSEIHERKLYKCEYCSKSFKEPSILRIHLNSRVHKNYYCNICSISFNKYQELKEHNKQEHIVSYLEHTCDICGKKFCFKNSLRLHMQDHMRANVIMCSYEGCNRIYYFQRNLEQHIRTFHMGEKWECLSCHAQLSSNQKLKAHIEKIHENPLPRKPPPTKGNRKKRRDAGVPKKSALSQLVGVILPQETEKDLMYRDTIKFESL